MKQRIEQLLNGNFTYDISRPELSVSEISVSLRPGDQKRGFFELSSPDEKRIRGFLYSSSPRMSFDPQQFNGTKCRIVYQADASGLNGGDEIRGTFTICCDRGELILPWKICAEEGIPAEKNVSGEEEKYPSLNELAQIARHDMPHAAAVFARADYYEYLKNTDPVRAQQYRSLIDADGPIRALEEYLIAGGIKEPVDISLSETSMKFARPGRSVRQTVMLNRQGWGYLELHISSDARFLRLPKTELTTLDFVGDHCPLEFIIDTNFLHEGKNLGRISIQTCYRTMDLDIVIEPAVQSADHRNVRVQRLMRKKLLTLYLDLRFKRIEMQAWIDRSATVIGSYRRAGGTDVFAELFLVQIYYADGKRMKARRMLQELGKQMYRFDNNEQYAYYLYLTTFFEHDAEYVDQVESKIQQMFLQKRDSWIMQWILLYLQERYLKDETAKLDVIEQQVRYGCSSPIMYLEALAILRKDPYALRKLGPFERKILQFAAKEHMLTEELACQTCNLVLPGMEFGSGLFRILKACYEAAPTTDNLKAILQLLIEGKCKDKAYFEWYELGVRSELRLSGLYDYYMETMDNVSIEKMPQIIRMYFSYTNTLNYHRKAAIYRNISDNRESVPAVYRSSRPGIEHFITQQLELGRIDSNLAVLYERFLTKRLLGHSLAHQLVKVVFTFRVTCKNPHMKSVIVVHDHLKREESVPLRDGIAKVQIYTEHARIYLEDEEGRRHTSTSLYMAERYIDSPLLMSFCRELAPDHPGLLLYTCSGEREIQPETLSCYIRACDTDLFWPWFQKELRGKVLRYLDTHTDNGELFDFLKSIRYSQYIESGKRELISLLTREGMYEEAFRLLEVYGCENTDPACLVRICSQNVLIREYDEDPVLLALCFLCFENDKYDDNILEYLVSWYDGPIENMKRLWECARKSIGDTLHLEEKILSVYLFTGDGGDNTEQIFWSYYNRLGKNKICRAYANKKAYEYLVGNLPVNGIVFHYIEENLKEGHKQQDVCLLALLQYYSGLALLDEEQEKIAASLIETYDEREIRFAFFRNFPEKIRGRCSLDDRVFLEYVANPRHTAVVNLREAGSDAPYEREPMKNCFEGIFVREFVLFDGEQIECYIEEYDGEELVRTTDLRTLSTHLSEDAPSDRYGLICRMSEMAAGDPDPERLKEELDSFRELDYLTREVFTLM